MRPAPRREILRSPFFTGAGDVRTYRDSAADGAFRFSVDFEGPSDMITDLE